MLIRLTDPETRPSSMYTVKFKQTICYRISDFAVPSHTSYTATVSISGEPNAAGTELG